MIDFRVKGLGDDKQLRMFTLETPHTSYILGTLGDDQLVHIYYGKKIRTLVRFDPWKKLPLHYLGQSPRREDDGHIGWQEATPFDFSTFGAPDLRQTPRDFPQGRPLPGLAIDADKEKKVAHFPIRPPFEVICPVCGTIQKSNRSICYQCSCKFFFDDDVD